MPPSESSSESADSGVLALRMDAPTGPGIGSEGQPSPLQNRHGHSNPCIGPRKLHGPAAAEPAEILRFHQSERQLHWAIAIPFMVCLATAAVLFFVYNPNPARPYRALFSWIHRLSGLCLVILPSWTLVRHRGAFALYLQNIREAWCWTMEDVKWLVLMGPSTLNKQIALPHQGKFNAAEKINFMMLTATLPMYVLTGVLIWLPGVAFLSWLGHLAMAATAIPLIFGHIFMATINPDTRVGLSGMISGLVDREWARHHYRRWYDENFPSSSHLPEPAPLPVSPVTAAAIPGIQALPLNCHDRTNILANASLPDHRMH